MLRFLVVLVCSLVMVQAEEIHPMKEVLNEANKSLAYQLMFLKDCPEAIPTIAQWVYDEWSSFDKSLTKDRLVKSLEGRLNDDKIPFTLVAFKEKRPVGVITLKEERNPEFADFPKELLWMGTLYVVPDERKNGLGQALLEWSSLMAMKMGYEWLYLYISNPEHVPWYTLRGAEVIQERPFRDHKIAIMRFDFQKCFAKNSVGIIPLKKDQGEWRIFLTQKKGCHEYWNCPKGKAFLHETAKEAAKRELKEETNLKVKAFLQKEPLLEEFIFVKQASPILKKGQFYIAEVEGKVVLQTEDAVNGKWFSLQEAIEITKPSAGKRTLERVRELLR